MKKVNINILNAYSIILSLISCINFLPQKSSAIAPEVVLQNYKKVTPDNYKDDHATPALFPKTSNLRRKSGSSFLAKGEPLMLTGMVTDLGNSPIENVRIKIWHANHMGYYNYLTDPEDPESYDQDFLSAGQSITDNDGKYNFLTIFPGFYGKRTPHIHMMVEHDDFETIELEMIFPNHPRNKNDPKILSLNSREKALITCKLREENANFPGEGKIAIFDIKLNGFHKTKHD